MTPWWPLSLLGIMFCWQDVGPGTSGITLTQHSTLRTPYQQWNVVVVVVGYVAASLPRWLATIDGPALYQSSVWDLKLKRSWVLQQDNDRKHKSKSTFAWLKTHTEFSLKPAHELTQFCKEERAKVFENVWKPVVNFKCSKIESNMPCLRSLKNLKSTQIFIVFAHTLCKERLVKERFFITTITYYKCYQELTLNVTPCCHWFIFL